MFGFRLTAIAALAFAFLTVSALPIADPAAAVLTPVRLMPKPTAAQTCAICVSTFGQAGCKKYC